jgi:hypothetical protein
LVSRFLYFATFVLALKKARLQTASFSKISREIENNLFLEFFEKLFSKNSKKTIFKKLKAKKKKKAVILDSSCEFRVSSSDLNLCTDASTCTRQGLFQPVAVTAFKTSNLLKAFSNEIGSQSRIYLKRQLTFVTASEVAGGHTLPF